MSFDTLGPGGLDYLPCRYGDSKLMFRGPKRSLKEPFIAFLGGTHTYGKFVGDPFVVQLEDRLERTCVNMGLPNAGLDVFLHDPALRDAVAKADITVIQLLSPRNLTNRYYAVHPRRNDRFLKASTLLKTIYRDVDFSDVNFTKHLLTRLHKLSAARFKTVVDELQQAWRARMHLLLQQIPGRKVLLWVSDHAPMDDASQFGRDPWFVTPEMIDELKPSVSAYVEVVASDAALSDGTKGMIFSDLEEPAAEYVLGPRAHEEVAEALAPVLRDLMD